jgi:hypothetical protein
VANGHARFLYTHLFLFWRLHWHPEIILHLEMWIIVSTSYYCCARLRHRPSNVVLFNSYSLRFQNNYRSHFRKITLIKYILKNINIYVT